MIIERKYQTTCEDEGSQCFTPCPFDPKGSFIGSVWCARCSHFMGDAANEKTILCNCATQADFLGVAYISSESGKLVYTGKPAA